MIEKPDVVRTLLLISVLACGCDTPIPQGMSPTRLPGTREAPEFEGISEWINSKPLTMKDLRGKVVVVHFMAFG